MMRASELAKKKSEVETIGGLSQVFEGIAGMRIAQIKNQVLGAQDFFKELWNIYTQVRVDSLFRFGRSQTANKLIDKELLIAVTAEGGLSGDIDAKLINWMLSSYKPEKNDIIVIGHHGAVQLVQAGVQFKKYFKLPAKDQNINAMPVIKEAQNYKSTTVYYQTYVSLLVQDIKRIELTTAVTEQGQKTKTTEDVISEETYIFEPSTFAVVDHLERTMLQIMFGQLILESKLAQYASRFRAMSSAHQRSKESIAELSLSYNKVKRTQKDERLKETLNGLRKAGA